MLVVAVAVHFKAVFQATLTSIQSWSIMTMQ